MPLLLASQSDIIPVFDIYLENMGGLLLEVPDCIQGEEKQLLSCKF